MIVTQTRIQMLMLERTQRRRVSASLGWRGKYARATGSRVELAKEASPELIVGFHKVGDR